MTSPNILCQKGRLKNNFLMVLKVIIFCNTSTTLKVNSNEILFYNLYFNIFEAIMQLKNKFNLYLYNY